MRPERRSELTAALLLGVSVIFWSGSFRTTAIATEHTSGIMLSALRAVPAAIILTAAVALLGAQFPRGRMWLWAAITGLLGVALFFVGLSEGTRLAGAGNTAVLANTPPFFVFILGAIFLGTRIAATTAFGLIVGFVGIVVMVSSQVGGGDTRDLVLGMALALAAAAGWGITTLIVKWLVDRDPKLDLMGLTAGQYIVSAVVLAALAFGVDGTGTTDWGSGDLWLSVLWLVLGASVLAYLAFFAALKRASAIAVSTSLFLVPVVAVVIEAVLENIPDGVVLGGMVLAIIGLGIVLVSPQLEERRARLRAPSPAKGR